MHRTESVPCETDHTLQLSRKKAKNAGEFNQLMLNGYLVATVDIRNLYAVLNSVMDPIFDPLFERVGWWCYG